RFAAHRVRKIAPRGCARCQTSQRDFAHPTNLRRSSVTPPAPASYPVSVRRSRVWLLPLRVAATPAFGSRFPSSRPAEDFAPPASTPCLAHQTKQAERWLSSFRRRIEVAPIDGWLPLELATDGRAS